jgi:predicted small lipoprotein YifL
MRTSILIASIAACALSGPIALAQDKAAPATAPMTMGADQQMSQMQVNIDEMQAQMARIQATTDPKVRQKLMQEHLQTMQASTQMMRGMMTHPMMANGGQPGGMGMAGNKDMSSADMMQRRQAMEQRANMMQSMMDQMQAHQEAMQSTPAR